MGGGSRKCCEQAMCEQKGYGEWGSSLLPAPTTTAPMGAQDNVRGLTVVLPDGTVMRIGQCWCAVVWVPSCKARLGWARLG